MQFSPVRTGSDVTDEQADTQQQPWSAMRAQDFSGPALPGLWKRAVPQSQATLQEQMVDLGRSANISRAEHQSAPRHTSLREQRTLPGQVQRAGKVKGSTLTVQKLETSPCRNPYSMIVYL